MCGDGQLHACPELVAGVSGAAFAHNLWVEDVDLDEVVGCQLLKPGPVPLLLCFAKFHQSPSFISLGDSECNILYITYNSYIRHILYILHIIYPT